MKQEESDEATLGFRHQRQEREEFLGLGEVTDHRRSHLEPGNVFLNQISQDTLDIDL